MPLTTHSIVLRLHRHGRGMLITAAVWLVMLTMCVSASASSADTDVRLTDPTETGILDITGIHARGFHDAAGKRWGEFTISPFNRNQLVGTRKLFLLVSTDDGGRFRIEVNETGSDIGHLDKGGEWDSQQTSHRVSLGPSSISMRLDLSSAVSPYVDFELRTVSGYTEVTTPYVPDGSYIRFDLAPDSGTYRLDLPSAPPPDTTPPQRPGGLQLNQPDPTTANLIWNEPADNIGVVGYILLRDGAIHRRVSNGSAFTDRNLNPRRQYTYSVIAVDAAGNESAPSATVTTKLTITSKITFPKILTSPKTPEAGQSFYLAIKVRNLDGAVEKPIASARATCRATVSGAQLRVILQKWNPGKGVQCGFAIPANTSGKPLVATVRVATSTGTGTLRRTYKIR